MMDIAEKILAGDRRALARAITAVENGEKDSRELVKQLFLAGRKAQILGVTGSAGVGKSTLVDKMAGHFRKRGRRTAILAVDPSSPFSGGALLGDRIRMQSHSADDGVYIRSMATRGALGGLAAGAWDAATVLEAGGFDIVIVETVGAGQDEVDITALADLTLLLLAPGMGDGVQVFKAGVMEIADIFVINKADCGDAARVERDISTLLGAGARPGGRQPGIIKTVATTGEGVEALCRAIDEFRNGESEAASFEREQNRWRMRIAQMARARFFERAAGLEQESFLQTRAGQVARREIDPHSVVEEWLQNLQLNHENPSPRHRG